MPEASEPPPTTPKPRRTPTEVQEPDPVRRPDEPVPRHPQKPLQAGEEEGGRDSEGR